MAKFWNIFRSPLGDYCDELAEPGRSYSDAVLSRIREDGFNAVWLRVVLRDCVATSVLPDLLPDPTALARLAEIVERCCRNELGVFVYLNEPLGFPEDHEFWQARPTLRGQIDQSFDDGWDRANALCTSQRETRQFLEEATHRLFQAVPDLAGAILITASEHLTHCYSHESKYRQKAGQNEAVYPLSCPRCATRKPWEVVGEVVESIERGIHSAAPDAEVIVWNWSWSYYQAAPQRDLIAALPAGVAVMVDFERGGHQVLSLAGKQISIAVDEYSLGYTGPSESFEATGQEVQRSGRSLLAKLQIGTTHEIATIPNLPLIPNLIKKLHHLAKIQAKGIVATWCFGTYASLNTYAVGWILNHPGLDESATLHGIARDYFPGCDSGKVVDAWEGFAKAFAYFPQVQDLLYVGPVNAAPGYPWELQELAIPMRPSWFPPEPYGNKIEEALGALALSDVIEAFDLLSEGWRESVRVYAEGLKECPAAAAEIELGVAKVIGHQMTSARNFMAFRQAVSANDQAAIIALSAQEIDTLRQMLPLLKKDSRLGFHQGSFPRPQKFFDPLSVEKKIEDLRNLQERLGHTVSPL